MASYYCGMQYSVDGGQTFVDNNAGLEVASTALGVALAGSVVMQDPTEPERLWMGRYTDGVYTQANRDSAWTLSFGVSDARVGCLVHDGTAIYACVAGLGVAHTTDGGQSWGYLNDGLPGREVRDMIWDNENETMYVSLPEGLFMRQGSNAWQPVQEGCLPSANLLAIVGNENGRLLVTHSGTYMVARPLP